MMHAQFHCKTSEAQFDLDDSGGKTQNSDLRDLARSVSPDPFHCNHIYSASASCEEE